MKTYELTYILSPEISSEEAESFAKGLETFVQSKEGLVIKQANPTAKALSYQIKKHASGFIGSIEFQLEPEALLELDSKVAKDNKVNRHMVVIKGHAMKERKRRSRTAQESVASEPENKSPKEITIEKKSESSEPTTVESQETNKDSSDKKVELRDIEEKLEELLGE